MKLFVYYSKVILLNHLVRETLYNFATPTLRNTAAHVKDTRIESGGTCTSFNLSKEPTNNLPKLGLHHIPAKVMSGTHEASGPSRVGPGAARQIESELGVGSNSK